MKRLVAVALMLSIAGCATMGKVRHIATVSTATTHAVLSVIQDVEVLLVCGRPTAPQPPQCVPLDKHHEIAVKFSQAYTLEITITKTLRDLPVGSPQPTEVLQELSQISELANEILAMLPDSDMKTRLVQTLQGSK